MNILFFSTMISSPWGGSEELWYKTALSAKDNGHKVYACVKYWGDKESQQIKTLKEKDVRVIYREVPTNISYTPTLKDKIRFRLKKHFGIIIEYNSLIKTLPNLYDLIPVDTDIICFSLGATYDLIYKPGLFELVEKLNIPYINISQFNYDYGFSLSVEKIKKAQFIFRKAKQNIFVSVTNHEFTEHQICSKLDNVSVINNPMNLSDFTTVPYPEDSKTLVFTTVARLYCKTKAIDIVIKVLAQGQWKDRDWMLNIYGEGEDYEYLSQLIEFYNLQNRVFLKGHVSDIRKVWEQSHLHILPSIAEGTPLALQEAMMCGRASVVTEVAGNTEWIDDNFNGFIAEAPTFLSLSRTLERAWSKKENWKVMGIQAHKTIKERINLSPEKELIKILSS